MYTRITDPKIILLLIMPPVLFFLLILVFMDDITSTIITWSILSLIYLAVMFFLFCLRISDLKFFFRFRKQHNGNRIDPDEIDLTDDVEIIPPKFPQEDSKKLTQKTVSKTKFDSIEQFSIQCLFSTIQVPSVPLTVRHHHNKLTAVDAFWAWAREYGSSGEADDFVYIKEMAFLHIYIDMCLILTNLNPEPIYKLLRKRQLKEAKELFSNYENAAHLLHSLSETDLELSPFIKWRKNTIREIKDGWTHLSHAEIKLFKSSLWDWQRLGDEYQETLNEIKPRIEFLSKVNLRGSENFHRIRSEFSDQIDKIEKGRYSLDAGLNYLKSKILEDLNQIISNHGLENEFERFKEGEEPSSSSSSYSNPRDFTILRCLELLKLKPGDENDFDKIKKSFRKISHKCHPDKHQNKSQAEQDKINDKYVEIIDAYEFLKERLGR